MKRLRFAIAIPAILAAWTAAAVPGADTLTYFGSRSRVCMNASGYDADFRLTGFGSANDATEDVVLVLNPDGTGTMTLHVFLLTEGATGPGAVPISVIDAPSDVTYTVTPDGLLTVTSASFLSITTVGAGAGQQTEITNVVNEFRLIDRQTKAVAVQGAPNVETLTNLATGVVSQRVCHRGGTLFLTSGKPKLTGNE